MERLLARVVYTTILENSIYEPRESIGYFKSTDYVVRNQKMPDEAVQFKWHDTDAKFCVLSERVSRKAKGCRIYLNATVASTCCCGSGTLHG